MENLKYSLLAHIWQKRKIEKRLSTKHTQEENDRVIHIFIYVVLICLEEFILSVLSVCLKLH